MARGHLRIYLGASPGVGKTFAMLNEGWRGAQRSKDVVVGFVEDHGRANTAAQVRGLETLPRRTLAYRDQKFEEMDVDAILARRPAVVLVDELAHTNVPGSRNEKRWQDVEELLEAGVDVISTVNIQHLESLNDVVERITGITQRETLPDAFVRAADQVELVDMSPEALRRRMAHGNIYRADKVDAALGNYFRVGNLTALRELALLWLADRVDESLQGYLDTHGISATWETKERVVVAMTGSSTGAHLIRRAARMASRAKGELIGVHIRSDDGLAGSPASLLDQHRSLLEGLGGTYHEIVGSDIPTALTRFARAEHATQIVLGASRRSRWRELTQGSIINSVIRASGDMDIHVISEDAENEHAVPLLRRRALRSQLSVRRRMAGWTIGAVGLPVLTLVLANLRPHIDLPGDLMMYLLLILGTATVGGIGPALVTAIVSGFVVNWFFTPPLHRFSVAGTGNGLALLAFVVVGVVTSLLVTRAARQSVDAARARAEAEALARVAAGLVGAEDPLPSMLARLRTTFDLQSAAVLVRDEAGTWTQETRIGEPHRVGADQVETVVELGPDARLALVGPTLAADDQRVLQAFTAQLTSALERRRLKAEAASAAVLTETDELRTALLRAVSHDLRSPLSSIKASVTSLMQQDVAWTPAATKEFLLTIDEETDRLNGLVGNLLDMSRLQSGALHMLRRPVGWEEVVMAALASLSIPTAGIEITVPEDLPDIDADPALLERALANIVANAVLHARGAKVRIEAGAIGERVDLRVIDQGPGVAPEQRQHLFDAFQRLGDQSDGSGVGLGLAVARGFVEALGGEIGLDDTPGGGLTVIVGMPRSGA